MMPDPIPVFQTLTKAQAAVARLSDLPLTATERAMLHEAAELIGMTTAHYANRVGIMDQFGRVTVAPPPPCVVIDIKRH